MLWNMYTPYTMAALYTIGAMNAIAVWTAFTVQAVAHHTPSNNKK